MQFITSNAIPIYFNSLDANAEPVAPSVPFEPEDFLIEKNDGTVKSTTNGITVSDTHNGITGRTRVLIDTTNNTGDTGFWEDYGIYNISFKGSGIPTVGGKSIAGRVVPDYPSFQLLPVPNNGQAGKTEDESAYWLNATFDRNQGGVDTGYLVPASGYATFTFIWNATGNNQAIFGTTSGSSNRFTVWGNGADNNLRVNFQDVSPVIATPIGDLQDGREYCGRLSWSGQDVTLKFNGATYTASSTGGGLPTFTVHFGQRWNNNTPDLINEGVIRRIQFFDSAGLLAYDSEVISTRECPPTVPNIDLFMVGGQSNAVGRAAATSSFTPNTARAFEFDWQDFSSVAVADPTGFDKHVSTSGSFLPSMLDSYLHNAERQALIVKTAVGGSAQTEEADIPASNSWDSKSGLLYDEAVGKLWKAINYYRHMMYEVNFCGIAWCQGEADAGQQGINGGFVTKQQYKDEFQLMMRRFRGEFSAIGDVHFFISQTGTKTDDDDAGFAEIRAAQQETADDLSYAHMSFTGALQFPSQGKMEDTVHYNITGLDEVGQALGLSAAEVINNKELTAKEVWEGYNLVSATPPTGAPGEFLQRYYAMVQLDIGTGWQFTVHALENAPTGGGGGGSGGGANVFTAEIITTPMTAEMVRP